jgi:hypothetical protein
MPPNPALDAAVSKSREIEFIPAVDDPGGAPWPFLSYYGIKYRVPIYSYHWLGRANMSEFARMQTLTIKRATECRWTTDRVYALKKIYLPHIEHCNYEPKVLATYPDWVVLQPTRDGSESPGQELLAFSMASSPHDQHAQTFSLVYRGGRADLVTLWAIIGPGLQGPGTCNMQIDPVHGQIHLLTDAGTAWKGPVTVGVPGTIENGQCTVSGTGSSVSAEVGKLTVRIALTFPPSFAGPNNVYANAIKAHGIDSGWKSLGHWTVSGGR